jgi:flagellar L-ring protein precursor FlgH
MRRLQQSSKIKRLRVLAVAACCLLAPCATLSQSQPSKKKGKQNEVQSSTDSYLAAVRARAMAKEDSRTAGSLWFPAAPMAETALDYKARHTGDLIVIRLVDNFSATATGTGSEARTLNASSGISALFGNLKATNRLQNLFSPNSAETLSGKGASTLNSTLSLNFAGRVVEALPNGVMVVEAVRDMTVGNDRQTIVLHGLVRPGDLASDGSVLSSQVSNLEAEIYGKGLVADSIRQPNAVIRALLKVLNF